jgi:large subunit ribosomal protein L19
MNAIELVEQKNYKAKLPDVRPGDTVRVHQMIREGSKQRVQVFEGVVIRRKSMNGLQASITVRKIASGVGVEKTWFLHSPNVVKIEVMRRAKVRRAFLGYMRGLRGKAARMAEQEFDRTAANEADARTAGQIAAEAQAEVEVAEAPAETAGEDVMRQADTVSTEEVAKDEAKEAKQADAEQDANAGDDEAVAEKVEAEAGEDKAEPKA